MTLAETHFARKPEDLMRYCLLLLTVLSWTCVGRRASADDAPTTVLDRPAAVESIRDRATTSADAGSVPDALHRYVARPEPDYAWTLEETRQVGDRTMHRLELTSQRWQDIVWKHALFVYEPTTLSHPRHMLLFVTGGRNGKLPSDGDLLLGMRLADLCGARVATLHQVPNQPLLGDHVEDDLITETWLKYLATGHETWPLLFPMVKSAVKAMDALQDFTATHGDVRVEGFVITGASKRGWTSWLAPVADRRIIATAPLVIDVLNFRAQMQHQMDSWGRYSEQIEDYTRKGLVKILEDSVNPRERRLRRMMDPYTYRYLLRLPKLMVVGTNDRYWTVDAMRLYYDDLVGPRYVLACPNVGHNLGDRKEFALTTIAAFFRHAAAGRPLPDLKWTFTAGEKQLRLVATSDEKPQAVRQWTATSDTRDFRESHWTSRSVEMNDGTSTAVVEKPAGRHTALFLEFEYAADDLTYSLTTQVYCD